MEYKHQLQWAEWSAATIKAPNLRISRFDNGYNRFYYWREAGQNQVGIGITSLFGELLKESEHVMNWKMSLGGDWREVLNKTSRYGTLLHTVCATWLIHKEVPKDMIESAREASLALGGSYNQIEKDLLSWMKFCHDYRVRPLVIEGLFRSAQLKRGGFYCMAVDILCEMSVPVKEKVQVEDGVFVRGPKKGQPKYKEEVKETLKPIVAVVDMKSNPFEKESKSFYESHKFQLIGAARAIKHNLGLAVDAVYNWSPNAWRKEPTYSLKEWKLEASDAELFDAYIEVAELRGILRPSGNVFIPPSKFTPETKHSDYKIVSYSDMVDEMATKYKDEEEIQVIEIAPEKIEEVIIAENPLVEERLVWIGPGQTEPIPEKPKRKRKHSEPVATSAMSPAEFKKLAKNSKKKGAKNE